DTKPTGQDVQILIGSDLRESMMTGRRYHLKSGLTAVETVFRWTLCGDLRSQNYPIDNSYPTTMITLTNKHESLNPVWSIGAEGTKESAKKVTANVFYKPVKDKKQKSFQKDSKSSQKSKNDGIQTVGAQHQQKSKSLRLIPKS